MVGDAHGLHNNGTGDTHGLLLHDAARLLQLFRRSAGADPHYQACHDSASCWQGPITNAALENTAHRFATLALSVFTAVNTDCAHWLSGEPQQGYATHLTLAVQKGWDARGVHTLESQGERSRKKNWGGEERESYVWCAVCPLALHKSSK